MIVIERVKEETTALAKSNHSNSITLVPADNARLASLCGPHNEHIRQLEDYAGTPLFKRTGRSVLLTDAAQAALLQPHD